MTSHRSNLRAALGSRDPYQVAAALEIPPIMAPATKQSLPTYNESLQFDGVDWSAVLNSHLQVVDACQSGQAQQAYVAQSALHSRLNDIFGSQPGNLLVPALHRACRNTHILAVAADDANGNISHEKVELAVTLLQKSFALTLNDRTDFLPTAPLSDDGSKKIGVLYIVNQLFSMYFTLNTLRLCKNLLKPVESRKLHLSGNKGDLVTYRYFVGRLMMFEDQYETAEENLEYALKHCHKKAINNKRSILRYLVPVKLYRGRLPTLALLQKYGLNEFLPLVEGMRRGDLRTFNEGLNLYQNLFIRRGIYLLLEKTKTVCYRNLFKRVYLVLEQPNLSLVDVARAFKWQGLPMDLDEIECILANLIFRGYVRGYLSHTKRILVLSKSNPFPTSAVIASAK